MARQNQMPDDDTLNNLFEDVRTGELATYFGILGKSLLSHLITIYAELDMIKEKLSCETQRAKEE